MSQGNHKSYFGHKNSNWKGGQRPTPEGRVRVYCPEHPHTINGRYVYRYRLVMEKKLGRFLLPTEIVHHINGDRSDDRIENLRLEVTDEHMRLHQRQRITEGRGYDPDTHKRCRLCLQILSRDRFSPSCKENPNKRSSLCKDCASESQRERRMKKHGRLPKGD